MRKNHLNKSGLSLSQAQSISNLCNQRASEINNILQGINNSHETVTLDGEVYDLVKPKPLPKDILNLLKEKAALHGLQAFLMENINAKADSLKAIQNETYKTSHEYPTKPTLVIPEKLPMVTEEYGWEQLTAEELAEYWEAEAYASHIGQFIHKDGQLTKLRADLVSAPTFKTYSHKLEAGIRELPIKIVEHHTSEQLLGIHEELADVHRKYEQRVNYFKAKVKNIVADKNTEIAKANTLAQIEANTLNQNNTNEYNKQFQIVSDIIQKEIKEASPRTLRKIKIKRKKNSVRKKTPIIVKKAKRSR